MNTSPLFTVDCTYFLYQTECPGTTAKTHIEVHEKDATGKILFSAEEIPWKALLDTTLVRINDRLFFFGKLSAPVLGTRTDLTEKQKKEYLSYKSGEVKSFRNVKNITIDLENESSSLSPFVREKLLDIVKEKIFQLFPSTKKKHIHFQEVAGNPIEPPDIQSSGDPNC